MIDRAGVLREKSGAKGIELMQVSMMLCANP